MNGVRVTSRDLPSEILGRHKDDTELLCSITSQVVEMRQRVEGLRNLMVPFDTKFAAAVKALTEVTMQLYMVVNDRAPFDPLAPVEIEDGKRLAQAQEMNGAH